MRERATHKYNSGSSGEEQMVEEGGFFAPAEEPVAGRSMERAVQLPVDKADGCTFCGRLPLSEEIEKVFGKRVCYPCSYSRLQFVTKTTCRQKYLLTEEELAHFRCLARPNPRKGTWNDMQLYLEEEIAAHSASKYGSLEEVARLREERVAQAKERRVKRLRGRVRDLKRQTFIAQPRADHTHKFMFSDGKGVCECGMEIEHEEL